MIVDFSEVPENPKIRDEFMFYLLRQFFEVKKAQNEVFISHQDKEITINIFHLRGKKRPIMSSLWLLFQLTALTRNSSSIYIQKLIHGKNQATAGSQAMLFCIGLQF